MTTSPIPIATTKRKPILGDKIWTLREFLNDEQIRKPGELLSPWLCEGDIWMIFSGPGVGKTFFNLNVAFAVASGGKFLHWQAGEPRKVLYVDGEMSTWDMQKRLKDIVLAAQKEKNGNIQAALENFRGYAATYQEAGKVFPDLAKQAGRDKLLEMAEGVDLVIIDNLTTVLREADPNDASDWTPVQDTVVELRKRGSAVILVHHTNKQGDQTGTKAKEAILNGMMKLERPKDYSTKDGARFKITWEKSRGLAGEATIPVMAHLDVDQRTRLPKWDYEINDQTQAYQLMQLARTGSYTTQDALAKELGINKSRISQIKADAINKYGLFTAQEFNGWLKTAEEYKRLNKEWLEDEGMGY